MWKKYIMTFLVVIFFLPTLHILTILYWTQTLVSFKKYISPPLPYFKVDIYPFPLPHFASIFFAYLWSFRWPNYIVTLPRYFSFRLPHLNIPTGPPSDELDKNSQLTWHSENLSHWNGKGKRVDVYLAVRKRRGHIYFEWNKCLYTISILIPYSQW
jgi:hypothetical protein